MSHVRQDIERLTRQLTTAPATADPGEVVVMLMGHLPIRGGLWRLPAAALLGKDRRHILIAREDDHELIVEHLSTDAGPTAGDPLQTPAGGCCVVVPPTGAEPDFIRHLDGDRLVLVTGADQAAVVAAYGMIKSLGQDDPMDIDLVIAGHAASDITETAARLCDAVARHLGHRLTLRGTLETVETSRTLVRSEALPRPAGGLREVVAKARQRAGSSTADCAPIHESSPEADAAPRRFLAGADVHSEDLPSDPGPSGEGAPESRSRPRPGNAANAPIKIIESVPDPQDDPSGGSDHDAPPTRPVSAPGEPTIAAPTLLDHLPGLRETGVRCPDHETVLLAADDRGHLHVVVELDLAVHLPAILGWVSRHRDLLHRAVPDLDRTGPEPAVHVFGDRVEDLLSIRETTWHPHLLVSAEAIGPDGQACVPLSRGARNPV